MDLREQLLILRRSWRLITVFTLLGVILAGVVSLLTPKSYTASTSLFVSTQNSETSAELQQGSVFALARVQSYVDVATTPAVLQPVITSLKLPFGADELASRMKASTARNTVIIQIEVHDDSPQRSADIANAVAASLISAVADLERPTNGTPSPVRLSSVDRATAPTDPTSPNVKLNLLLGLLYGLAAGLGGAVLQHVLDRNIRTEADLKRTTDLPVLGAIADGNIGRAHVGTPPILSGIALEAFRQLRTNLRFTAVNRPIQSIVVTSSSAGEGKSTVALNLALTMAKAGQRVLLIDADLRLPTVARATGLVGDVGLTTVLVGASTIDESIQPWSEDNLSVLTSGALPPNPSELLGSGAMGALIAELEHRFDTVIIDSPPILPVTDATLLTKVTDGVLLVVGTKRVSQHNLGKAIDQLTLVDANIIGVVRNRIPMKGPDANSAYLEAYGAHPDHTPARMLDSRAAGVTGHGSHIQESSVMASRASES